MKARILSVCLLAGLAALPLAAQDSGQGSSDTGSSSGDDMFNTQETVTQTDQQTQNNAPRDALLKEAAPRITGTFTGTVASTWNWADIYSTGFDITAPSSESLDEQQTGVHAGFVARPDTDISVTGELRSTYPFAQQITANGSTDSVPDVTVWSLYSKFTWNDALFLSFGQQPLKWGTGYFFSPADDVFAQSAVDLSNPTAERQGPLALKVQYPIPHTQDNLYLIAALPQAATAAALAAVKPQDISVGARAEALFGNTELAAAGYYQRNQRPQAILTGTTGNGDLNFFGEGLLAFPDPVADPVISLASSPVSWAGGKSDYTITDRSGQYLFSGTAGIVYTNQDLNLTVVAQYLYNGAGYTTLTEKDILQALTDRALSQPAGEPAVSGSTLLSSFTGLGKIGMHYVVGYASLTSIANSKVDVSVLALANLSDGSGYVSPTVTLTALTYVKVSGGLSLSWGGSGTEFADPSGFASMFPTLNGQPNPSYNPAYVAEPTLSLTLNVSVGTVSF